MKRRDGCPDRRKWRVSAFPPGRATRPPTVDPVGGVAAVSRGWRAHVLDELDDAAIQG
jgi:hypothetical protein